jgi:hypothetical protein
MDALRELLDLLKRQEAAQSLFLGLLHILIARRISRPDGSAVSGGLTWRELAALLKRCRWDRDAAKQVDLDPEALPPRDRERYWYTVIARAGVDSAAAKQQAERLASLLEKKGYVVSAAVEK